MFGICVEKIAEFTCQCLNSQYRNRPYRLDGPVVRSPDIPSCGEKIELDSNLAEYEVGESDLLFDFIVRPVVVFLPRSHHEYPYRYDARSDNREDKARLQGIVAESRLHDNGACGRGRPHGRAPAVRQNDLARTRHDPPAHLGRGKRSVCGNRQHRIRVLEDCMIRVVY